MLGVGQRAPQERLGGEGLQQVEVALAGLMDAGEHAVDDTGPELAIDAQPVTPSPARSRPPPSSAAPSSARTTVVPTATTRPPAARVCATAATVSAGMSKRSGSGRAASSAGSPVEERPAAWVTAASLTPRRRASRSTRQVSGRPAEGASDAHGREAYAVCTCHSARGARTYEYWTGRPLR